MELKVEEMCTGKLLIERLKEEYSEYHNQLVDDLMEMKPLKIEIIDIHNL